MARLNTYPSNLEVETFQVLELFGSDFKKADLIVGDGSRILCVCLERIW